MKIMKFAFTGIAAILVIGLALWAVNYYIYSWVSLFIPLGCEEKRIGMSGHKLSESYDLSQIMTELQLNENYKVQLLRYENGFYAVRNFRGINYKITLRKEIESGRLYHVASLSNYPIFPHGTIAIEKGEEKTTPDYYIRRNINQMIDEMPLSDAQKEELKEKVVVTCSGGRMPS